MLYLFILESIGTSELVLIAFIALIVFGPRKLPQMARTIGKAMSEFRRSTDDFKRTWEKEVKFEDIENGTEENSKLLLDNTSELKNSIGKNNGASNNFTAPEIKEVNQEDFAKKFNKEKIKVAKISDTEKLPVEKRDWL